MLPTIPRLSGLGATTTIDSLAQSIARFEGYNVAGSVAQRNNNPGNLRSAPGQVGTDSGGYAIFPDSATGYAALDNQIQLNVSRGLTLDEFFAGKPGVYPGYAPSADSNNPAQYASTVGGWLGIDPSIPLSDVLSPSDSASGSPTTPSEDAFDSMDTASETGMSMAAWGVLALVLIGGVLLIRR